MRWWNLWVAFISLVTSSAKADSCSEALKQCVNSTALSFGHWSCKNTCVSEDQTFNHQEPEQARSSPDDSLPSSGCIQCICECLLQQPSVTTTATCTATITQCTSSTTSVMPLSGPHQESDSRVTTALICLAVIVVLVHVVGGVVFAAIKVRKRARRRTETLPPWPRSIQVSGRALRNPAYSAEGFVGPPTSYTEPAIYKEVEVSSSFCSEDEPEKPFQNPLYSDVTQTTTVPQMPSRINQKNSRPLVVVHREPVGKNLHSKEGLARCQPGIRQGKYPTNSTPMQVQGYAKLNATTRYTSLEGGKPTKNIATPLGVSHDYSRLEH